MVVRYSYAPYRRRRRLVGRAKGVWHLVQVLALAAATFLLLPLAVHAEPGDEFTATFDNPGGSQTLHCQFTGQEALPGDTVWCRMRIANGSSVDGSFFVFINEDSIKVTRCPDQGTATMEDDFREDGECLGGRQARIDVPETDPDFATFVGFWQFSMTTRPLISRSLPSDADVAYDERYVETCAKRSLAGYDAGPMDDDASQMCDLGLIRAFQNTPRTTDTGEQTYERQYFFGMTERDTGLDQTRFRGWDLHFDFTIRMKVPADDPCPGTRVNGICSVPVYQRR